MTSAIALELKGNLLPLMVLRVLDTDIASLDTQLAAKIAQAPALFQRAPVLVDVQAMQEHEIDLAGLVQMLKHQQMIPVALRGGDEALQDEAVRIGLGIMPATAAKKPKPTTPTTEAANNETIEPEPPQTPPAKVLTRPVRSGQQVVAMQGDLVVLSSVSPGAEVLAKGNIHIYGTLRGRALAGVQGDTHARIFCHHLDAELVAVAGQYQVNEELDDAVRGQAAQIYLRDDSLVIDGLSQAPR